MNVSYEGTNIMICTISEISFALASSKVVLGKRPDDGTLLIGAISYACKAYTLPFGHQYCMMMPISNCGVDLWILPIVIIEDVIIKENKLTRISHFLSFG